MRPILSRPVTVVLVTPFLFVLIVGAATWAHNAELARTAPDPSRTSAFLQSYSPQPVIETFAVKRFVSWAGEGKSAEGGSQSVKNDRQFQIGFVACGEERSAVTAALDQDILTRLRFYKAIVLLHAGTPQTGIHMVYRMNRTLGFVHLLPVRPETGGQRATPLTVPLEDLTADLTLSETWFRTEKVASHALEQTHLF